MLRAILDVNCVVLSALRPLKLADVETTISLAHLIPGLLTEWCSLCGNDRYYWPALKGPGISCDYRRINKQKL